jgi:glutamate--cysteine ligase
MSGSELPSPNAPVRHEEALMDYFLRGAKPPSAWGVGLEYERLGLDRRSGRAIPYAGRRGVEGILELLSKRCGWEPTRENDHIIALARKGAAVTLEPGGQLELSGAVHRDLPSVRAELRSHIEETTAVSDPLEVSWVPLGLQPMTPIEEIGWVPKGRYRVMAPYMAERGSLAQHMMRGTAGVQVNLDYSDESDAVEKLRTAMGISSIVTAACANSPLYEGRPNGYMSQRAHIWEDTDPSRCGMPEFTFREDLSLRHYLEYALDVPMLFVLRDERWISMEGMPFRRFLREGWVGIGPTYADWILHLTSIFTEVRLKTYVEARGADSVSPEMALAVAALWKGILYEPTARRAAWELVAGQPFPTRVEFQREVARLGPAARLGERSARDLALELVRIAREGLGRLAASPEGAAGGADEAALLEPLRSSLEAEGGCPAARLLRRWEAVGKPGAHRIITDAAAANSRDFLGQNDGRGS